MPECICPNCKTFFSTPSSMFGETYHCNSCGSEFKLDIVHLVRYELPSIIRIQLQNPDGTPFTRFAVPVMVNYGYQFPPLRSNPNGQILISKEMFKKARLDETSTGIMDYKGDYSLNRFIRIEILERSKAVKASNARSNSQWQILDFEKEVYGNMKSLIAAYIPDEDIISVEASIDLSKVSNVYDLELKVQCKN